jgi:hypothetical protein
MMEHTDVAAISARADALIAETKKTLAAHPARRGTPRRAAGLDSPETIDYLLSDLHSSADGKRLGKQFAHDPYALARSLGIAVHRAPLDRLQNSNRPSITITGTLLNVPGLQPIVRLADSLDARESARVLCHELGHYLGLKAERHCDQFAQRFMEVADSETPWGRASAFKASLLESARAHGGWR